MTEKSEKPPEADEVNKGAAEEPTPYEAAMALLGERGGPGSGRGDLATNHSRILKEKLREKHQRQSRVFAESLRGEHKCHPSASA
jgi:hypothetical protein